MKIPRSQKTHLIKVTECEYPAPPGRSRTLTDISKAGFDESLHVEPCLFRHVGKCLANRAGPARLTAPLAACGTRITDQVIHTQVCPVCRAFAGIDRANPKTWLVRTTQTGGFKIRFDWSQFELFGHRQRKTAGVPQAKTFMNVHGHASAGAAYDSTKQAVEEKAEEINKDSDG